MSKTKRVPNTARKFGEADYYVHFRLNGQDHLALPSELERPRQRAIQQPEDIPPREPWWRRVWDALRYG
jgi:hypothetical protein